MNWDSLVANVLAGEALSREQCLGVLATPDDDLLPLLQAAFRVRFETFGRTVAVHVLQNAKSGACSEDCAFCSQAVRSSSQVERYRIQHVDELLEGARGALKAGATTYCIVAASKRPSRRELETVCEAVALIKSEMSIKICASLGLLNDDQARQLAQAGVDRYNHNLENSRRFFPHICTTHTYDDRVQTIQTVKELGLEVCCGGILGAGESLDDRVDLAFELGALDVQSIPINFLDPRPGTPLQDAPRLAPTDCLKALAMFRFVNPTSDLRIAGGREVNLRHMQAFALYPANSIFTNGYLTTPGQSSNDDIQMIEDAGFTVQTILAS